MTTKKPAAVTTVRMKASEFRDLVSPVMPLADQGWSALPILNAVLIEGHGPYLTATATDRYRLGVQRHRLTAPGFHAIVDLRSLRAVLSIFKATRKANPELSITAGEGKLTVESTGLDIGGITGSLSWSLVNGEYPKVMSVIRDANEATETGTLTLNPSLLADFKAAQRSGDAMVLRGAPGKAVFVQIGPNFVGAIMPMRHDHGIAEPDVDWVALLTATKAEDQQVAS